MKRLVTKIMFSLCCLIVILFCNGSVYAICENFTPLSGVRFITPSSTTISGETISDQYGRHLAVNRVGTAKNILVLHLVGSMGCPERTQLYPLEAANNGYHVISVAYPNRDTVGSTCNQFVATDTCYEDFRREVVTGSSTSGYVSVDVSNSVINRTVRLLQKLNSLYPTENWSQYLNTQGTHAPKWRKIIVSGHSQGGGNAVFLGKTYTTKRIIGFSAPVDSIPSSAPAAWQGNDINGFNSQTATTNYFTFFHNKDEVIKNSYALTTQRQVTAFFQSVFGLVVATSTTAQNEDGVCPYGQLIVTDDSPAQSEKFHSSPVVDEATPKDNLENPTFKNIWRYLLNSSCS